MIKRMVITPLALCAMFLAVQPAQAETLAEKERHATEEKAMASSLENVKKQCQADISLAWDWSGFTKEELEDRGAATFCAAPFTALADICSSSADGLKAVQSSVKKVTCKRATPRRIELKDGELTFGIDYNAPNNEDAVRDYLNNAI